MSEAPNGMVFKPEHCGDEAGSIERHHIVAMSLLDAASGHLSNISTMGVALQD